MTLPMPPNAKLIVLLRMMGHREADTVHCPAITGLTQEQFDAALAWLKAARYEEAYRQIHHWYNQPPGPRTIPAGEAKRKRRLSDAKNKATHTRAQWMQLAEFCGRRCLACSSPEFGKDHIVPISKGGSDGIENLQPLCHACNSSKHDHEGSDLRPAGWREALGL